MILTNNIREGLRPEKMFRISKDSPAYYLTVVAKDRLPVFRTSTIARITCEAINEARRNHKFSLFSYVIMPDHFHLVTDNSKESKDIQRLIKGVVGRRVLDHLKSNGQEQSLSKLRTLERSDGSKYTLWQRNSDIRLLWSDSMLWQRIQYTHLNPVRAGLAEHPNDWKWSSARIFHSRRLEDEPLEVDSHLIAWHK